MRQIRSGQNEVARAVALDAIADKTRALAADEPGQFELRMVVPRVIGGEIFAGKVQTPKAAFGVCMHGLELRIDRAARPR